MLKSISDAVSEHREEIKGLSGKIHSTPELGFEEEKACKWQIEALKKWGFKVESPISGLKTAYRAIYGSGTPAICFMSEYDALAGLGHACGHNLIMTNALTAGLAVKKLMRKEKLKGRVIIMGTPAEEGKGGKEIMIREKAFKGIDMVLTSHPYDKTSTDPGWISLSGFTVEFRGLAAHASAAPEQGINALDAVNLLFSGVNAWRQQLPEAARIHGIIRKGGELTNVIPEHTECEFYLRADTECLSKKIEERFRRIVAGAAMMTDTKYQIKPSRITYKCSVLNKALNDEFFKVAEEAGLAPEYKLGGGRGSTDFGNVSQIIPGASFFFAIAPAPCPLHSIEFQKAAGTAKAFEQAFKTGQAMAAIGLKFMKDKKFRDRVKKDFRKHIK